MTSEPREQPVPTATSSRKPRARVDDIQEAYLTRALKEVRDLEREMDGCPPCREAGLFPIKASGAPTAQVMLVKWSAGLAERQEGVAFFGRSGEAIRKSVGRLGIDPASLYGTLCVKCPHPGADGAGCASFRWLAQEVRIVSPAIVVVMGAGALDALNGLDVPLAAPLTEAVGTVQRWTPAMEALYVPDIDESLDEQQAKRRFWTAFRALGEWHQAQPPY